MPCENSVRMITICKIDVKKADNLKTYDFKIICFFLFILLWKPDCTENAIFEQFCLTIANRTKTVQHLLVISKLLFSFPKFCCTHNSKKDETIYILHENLSFLFICLFPSYGNQYRFLSVYTPVLQDYSQFFFW